MFTIIVFLHIENKLCTRKRICAFCGVIVTDTVLERLLETVRKNNNILDSMCCLSKTVLCGMFRPFQKLSLVNVYLVDDATDVSSTCEITRLSTSYVTEIFSTNKSSSAMALSSTVTVRKRPT